MLSVQSARQLKNMLLYKFIVIVEKKKQNITATTTTKYLKEKKTIGKI